MMAVVAETLPGVVALLVAEAEKIEDLLDCERVGLEVEQADGGEFCEVGDEKQAREYGVATRLPHQREPT